MAELEEQRFAVRHARDGPAAFALMAQHRADLLLVYAVLPGMPGIDVCRRLRRAGSEIPIIVLSPRGDEIDVVVAMEVGADDFIAEPYGARELVARVRAVLRRSNRQATQPSMQPSVRSPGERYSFAGHEPVPSTDTVVQHGLSPHVLPARIMGPRHGSSRSGMLDHAPRDATSDVLTVGDLSLDSARHEVTLRGNLIDLPRREFLLLEVLLEKPGRLLTRQVLIARIWGPGSGSRRILSTLVSRLRALIESNADTPSRIVTIRGIGYRYDVPSEDKPSPPIV
jgi:DNA-binding response OmpR family regulator